MHVPKCVFCLPTEKPQVVSLPPETLSVSLLPPRRSGPSRGQLPKLTTTSKKDGEQLAGSGRRSKKHLKDSPSLLTATNQTCGSGTLAQGNVDELSAQTRDSLRWVGVLEDPQAEEKRLELYRANRRQRYISHREALLKEIQYALRQTFPNESKEKKTLTGSDQRV